MKKITKKITDQIVKTYNPEKVILFGSYAYGKPNENSDLDIAIIKNTTKTYHDRLIELRKLVRTTFPIDFFVFTPDEINKYKNTNPMVKEILDKGKVIYG